MTGGPTYVVEWNGNEREFADVEAAYRLFAQRVLTVDGRDFTPESSAYLQSVVLWIREMPHTGSLRGNVLPIMAIDDATWTVRIDTAAMRSAFEQWRDGIDVRGSLQAQKEMERWPELASGFLVQQYPPKSGRASTGNPVGLRVGRQIDRALGRR